MTIRRIEAVISTAGNNEEYVGRHLGNVLLGRPLTRMVVVFEADLSFEECQSLASLQQKSLMDAPLREHMGSRHAITVHSVRLLMNFNH